MSKKKKETLPKIFRKQYSEKKLNKKILKRIHIPKERKMVQGLFLPAENGKLEMRQDLEADLLARLKSLAKTIKKNKGAVTTWKAAILLILLGIGLIFNLFFKDKLIKQSLERGLQSVFQAEASVEKPRLSLLKGEFSYESLQVADEGNLSRNLIETGPARFHINIGALTRKRVFIEESSLSAVQWNTLRETEASPLESQPIQEKEKKEGDSSLAVLAFTPEEMDYHALLDEQKGNLKSLDLINSGNERAKEFTERWTGIFDAKQDEINDLMTEVKTLEGVNIQNIQSVEEGQDALKQLESVYPKIETTSNSMISLREDFAKEKKELSGLYDEVDTLIEEDMDYLKGLLDFSSGDMRSLASGAAEKYIRNRWNDYYEKGLKALAVYEKFQARQKESKKEDKGKGPAREGRYIPFPSPDMPNVLVDRIYLSGGATEALKAELDSLTDNPDKLGKPTTFLADWQTGGSAMTLKGVFDARSDAEKPFSMSINAPGNSFHLDEGIPTLQISAFRSEADLSGESFSVEKGILTNLTIQLSSIVIDQENPDSFIAEAVKEIMNEIEFVELQAQILVTREGIKEIGIETDLDNILADKIGDYIKGLSGEAEEELRDYLTDYLTPFLKENQTLQSLADEVNGESLDQLSSLEDMENLMDNKKQELTGRTTAILDGAKAEAARLQAESEQRAREEADRIREEAEKALEDAAKNLKLPGF